MTIRSERFTYDAGGTACAGYLAWDDALEGARPGVIVSHTVRGPTAFEEKRAETLAALGYVGFALDVYGIEARTAPGADSRALMNALNADRALLHERLGRALDVLKASERVDPARVAAIGYCFGGKCVLDLARTRADIGGVAPFHGLFDPPPFATLPQIAAKVLVLHGWDDPLAKPGMVLALADELTAKGCDWQLHGFGHTGHAFTNPEAHDRAAGLFYRAEADRRSWAALTGFLAELFG